MAYELPMDLIQQVKKATRAEAGLSNYDPARELPPIPSLSETVAAFDPSPPYLRCKNCKGRLLRGVQSFICIYCGRVNDFAPDPISFKDTIACRWLLESLRLDGSEMVGPSIEKSEVNRGKSTSKDEISLSDFLDVKITWQAEAVKEEIGVSNKKPERRNYANFTGIDVDSFFSGSKSVKASNRPEEFSVRNIHDEAAKTKAVATHENLSFFQNVPHSEPASSSSEDKGDAAFSGWEADFKSAESGHQFGGSMSFHPSSGSAADSDNHNESSKPSGLFNVSSVDLSSQLDSTFGPGEDLKDGKSKDDYAASHYRVDLSSHLDSVFGTQEDSKDRKMKDASADSPSAMDYSSQQDLVFELKKQSKDGKTMDRSAASPPTVKYSSQIDSVLGLDVDLKAGRTEENSAASPVFADWKSDDLWSNMNSKVSQQNSQHDATGRVQDAPSQDNQGNLSTSFDWFQADQGQSNNTNAITSNTTNGDDDFFNEWNDFTSSTSVQDSSGNGKALSHNQSIVASGKTTGSNVLSSNNNLKEMDFGSFSEILPIRSSENAKTEMNIPSDILSTDRSIDTERNTSDKMGQPAANGQVNSVHAQPSTDVEILLSQMHDLSFMLENDLSLPPKSGQ